MNLKLSDRDLEEIIEIRHQIHMHPEVSGKEYRTTEIIREFLEKLEGVEIIDFPLETGLIARLKTGHAVGITSDNGTELLIHIGLDTVELEGKPFDIKAENNANVKRGDLLIEFNIEEIKAAGKEIQSPVIITNTDDKTITSLKLGQINHGEDLLKIEA